mmetsp:Transcript_14436/g.26675  ORF Transcript_14436/g.26675 Transcript_14436/m.26675 type:complete len:95 (-) Transcript_14436:407-691(-)
MTGLGWRVTGGGERASHSFTSWEWEVGRGWVFFRETGGTGVGRREEPREGRLMPSIEARAEELEVSKRVGGGEDESIDDQMLELFSSCCCCCCC